MLSTLKAVINNYRQGPYIKNINNVNLKKLSDDNNTMYFSHEEGSRVELDRLENEVRVSNLNVFLENYLSLRKYRFLYVTLPALLTAASALSFKLPSKVEFNAQALKYTANKVVYSSSRGDDEETETVYRISEFLKLLKCEIVSDDEYSLIDREPINEIQLKVHDYKSAVNGSVTWGKDGKLSAKSFSKILEYLDLDEYKDVDFKAVEDEAFYVDLYNRIVNILEQSNLLKKDDKELFEYLNNSEKKEVILNIIEYTEQSEEDILLSCPLIKPKLFFVIFTLLYYLYTIFFYYLRKEHFFVSVLETENGSLKEKDQETKTPGNLFYEAIVIKQAYLKAERQRILSMWEEAKDNIAPDDRGKIFSKYEKKLIKKYTGEETSKK